MPDGLASNLQYVPFQTAPAADLPCIEALGRYRVALFEVLCAGEQPDEAQETLRDRDERVRELIGTLQAKTFGDAIVQMAVAMDVLDNHKDLDPTDDEVTPAHLETMIKDVQMSFRIAASVLAVLIKAYAGDPKTIIDGWAIDRTVKLPIGPVFGEAA